MLRFFAMCCFLAIVDSTPLAQAQWVYTDRVFVSHYAGSPVDSIGVNTGGNSFPFEYMQVMLDFSTNRISFSSTVGATAGYWFIVPEGTVIDSPFTSFMKTQLQFGQTFIFGCFIDNPPTSLQIAVGHEDWFGWARVTYTDSGTTDSNGHEEGALVLDDSAVVTGGYGIIAGTTTIVAEPTSIMLAAIGLIGLPVVRRSN